MSSVKYHHGDLPHALREAASEVIAESGVAGFSLREVARRAGVSHAAPAHHFGSAAGLLTALAIEGFELLEARLAEAAASVEDPAEQLVAQSRAYIRTGLERPAHLAVMFREDCLDGESEQLAESGAAAFAVLTGTLERVRDRYNPALDIDDAAALTWSSVQGLLDLAPTMAAMSDTETERIREGLVEQAARLSRLMLDGLIAR